MAKELENIKNQRKALKACLLSGNHKAGYTAVGVSRSTWNRYLKADPSFSVNVEDAIEKGKFLRGLKYSGNLTKMATKLAFDRLRDGTASDRLIISLLPLQILNGEDEMC